MNPDPFEAELRRQSLRSLPQEWRSAILSHAESPAAVPAPQRWQAWLWPHPGAWGALAAAWVLIAALTLAGRPDPESPATASAERLAAATLLAQGPLTRQFAEYFRPAVPPPALAPSRHPANGDQGWIFRPTPARV